MNYKEIPLPQYAYIPGVNARHVEGFLDHVKNLAPSITTNENASNNHAWLYGIRLFENQFYWECHEVLETVWMNALPNSREKYLVQGVIHLANAALKIKMKKPAAAKKLSVLAMNSFSEAYSGGGNKYLMLLHMQDLEKAIKRFINTENPIKIMIYNA